MGDSVPIFPMALSLSKSLFEGSATADTSPPQLEELQREVANYFDGLERELARTFTGHNGKLRRSLRKGMHAPLPFLYFQVQQRIAELGGVYSLENEQMALRNLAALLER